MNKYLVKYYILFLLLLSDVNAQTDSYFEEVTPPLRNYTFHIGLGIPVILYFSAEMHTDEQTAVGIRFSRQWIKSLPLDNYPDLLHFLGLRFLYGTSVGITASYFIFTKPKKFMWYELPNRIRTEIALLIPTPAHDISPNREHTFGLSWELLLGTEKLNKGVSYFFDIGVLLMSLPDMKPVIGPVFKFGLAINL
jgi:hypothetical protein